MLAITALLHTENDAMRLGRCLETLYPCDEIVIVDHGSRDATVQIAWEYGARVVKASPGTGSEFDPRPIRISSNDDAKWILCLDPRESLSESLAASLFELKSSGIGTAGPLPAFSVFVRQERAGGWLGEQTVQTRLVPRNWNLWEGPFPKTRKGTRTLEGNLLRFDFP
jgi:glycosyltransferase involved in cell wall biosynthesis